VFSSLGVPELLIIAAVILLLFGAKKLPDMARSLGRSARILKAETRGMREDDAAAETADPVKQTPPPQLPQAAQPPTAQGPQVAPPIEQTQAGQANKNVG